MCEPAQTGKKRLKRPDKRYLAQNRLIVLLGISLKCTPNQQYQQLFTACIYPSFFMLNRIQKRKQTSGKQNFSMIEFLNGENWLEDLGDDIALGPH